ncbi:MAG TPA: tRNA (adenosine(37)-N6)-threonylcarbamoyltransferase complex dimerization subunit type 1 TsaB [Vicinamibacterales bacterium]|jgi:tRNA threonylcarbamoyladenosine biosynthesis protein TsaB|nr:tRNA (adenosine(37)-N6)-threonylcarbamoyltransferase complex dimerization subunit type 1 TsaB [Vicinamibacterales bacterium]
MPVLSLDTTTRAGSVALVIDGRVVEERSGDASRTHAERLPAEMIALLAAHGRTLADIDLFAVASGPGSFTGLRIGTATIQGAAFVHHRPVVAVSALEALAHAGSANARQGEMVGAWIDAHRHDVFSALYRVAGAEPFAPDRLVEIEGPRVGAPAATLARWRPNLTGRSLAIVGDGAVLYADVIAAEAESTGPAARVLEPTPQLAGTIALMALRLAKIGAAVEAAGIRPLYVRRPDAEIDRERKNVQHQGHKGHEGTA